MGAFIKYASAAFLLINASLGLGAAYGWLVIVMAELFGGWGVLLLTSGTVSLLVGAMAAMPATKKEDA
jgi:hypothetical protein